MKNKKGFTLVELIVVISILAILGTVWFIMLWSYNKDARDAKRLADLNNLEKAMDLYFINNWNYPDPSWYSLVTYSWAEVWKQWTIWDDTISSLWNINAKPVDPLTQTEYSYSLLNTWDKYELWALLEWNLVYSSILPNTYAAVIKNWSALIKWNFNKTIVEVSTWGLTYALAVPTIIASDLSNSDLMSIISNKALAYNWYSNIPASYSSKGYKSKWWFDFNWTNPNNVLLFNWNISDLNKWWVVLKAFSDKLKAAYSWTTISNKWIYKQILAVDTNNVAQIGNVISPIINKALSLKVALSTNSSFSTNVTTVTTPPNTCTTIPTFTNLWTSTIWTPTSVWQVWTYSATPWNCTYTCSSWYTWNNCTTITTITKTMFATSTKYNWNLWWITWADTKCTTRATAVWLNGTYKAMLPVAVAWDIAPGLPIMRYIISTTKYINTLWSTIVNNGSDFTIANLLSPILDEAWNVITWYTWVWDPSIGHWNPLPASYNRSVFNCDNWTSTANHSEKWNPNNLNTNYWFDWDAGGNAHYYTCWNSNSIYCIEQ